MNNSIENARSAVTTPKLAEAYDNLCKIKDELENNINTLWDLHCFISGEHREIKGDSMLEKDPQEVGVLEVHRRRVIDIAVSTQDLSEIINKLVPQFK